MMFIYHEVSSLDLSTLYNQCAVVMSEVLLLRLGRLWCVTGTHIQFKLKICMSFKSPTKEGPSKCMIPGWTDHRRTSSFSH